MPKFMDQKVVVRVLTDLPFEIRHINDLFDENSKTYSQWIIPNTCMEIKRRSVLALAKHRPRITFALIEDTKRGRKWLREIM